MTAHFVCFGLDGEDENFKRKHLEGLRVETYLFSVLSF